MTTQNSPRTPYTNFTQQAIGGAWRTGSSTRVLTDTSPFDGARLTEIRSASQDDVDDAYRAAQHAQRDWARQPGAARAQVLHDVVTLIDARGAEIIDWLVRESGSTRIKAAMELGAARAITAEAATFPARLVESTVVPSAIDNQESRVHRVPLGVVGVISPWNFPFHLTMRSVAPALALGNAVVVKPASDTPVTGGLLLAKLFEEAGLPPGVLNVVVGSGSEIGDFFVAHAVPRMISFTGSTEVGRGIGRIASGGQHIKRVALELGGNAPLVVLDDADIEQAAHAAVVGRFLHQGQICMSTNRVIVDASVHDAFVEAVVRRVRDLRSGDPALADTVVGPLINAHQLQDVQRRVAQAVQDGAKLLVGGEAVGNVLPPHVFSNVDPAWSIARDESFGPLLPIITARDEAHALELANDTEFGLSSAVFTRDRERGLRFALGIVAGMTHINDISVDDQPNVPFGGEKNSGLGRFNGQWALEEFTRTQWITFQSAPRPYPF